MCVCRQTNDSDRLILNLVKLGRELGRSGEEETSKKSEEEEASVSEEDNDDEEDRESDSTESHGNASPEESEESEEEGIEMQTLRKPAESDVAKPKQIFDQDSKLHIVSLMRQYVSSHPSPLRCESVSRSDALTEEQCDVLERKIKADDESIAQIFSEYEQHHDAGSFLARLMGVAAGASPRKGTGAAELMDDAAIERKFLHIVQTMTLSQLETTALRLAIARGDARIREALEQFRVELNDDVLVAALRSIAGSVIEEANQEDEEDAEQQSPDEEATSEAVSEAPEEEDDKEEEDAQSEEEGEGEEATGREGGSSISSQYTRNQLFPILLGELVKESIFTEEQQQNLLKRFGQNDPVIAAALDVYDLDNNMGDLVDTLQRVHLFTKNA